LAENILNPSIKKLYPEFIELYLKYSNEHAHQFEKFTNNLIDVLLNKYLALSKNNLEDYFFAEFSSYTTLFPEFSSFNKEIRSNKLDLNVAKRLDLFGDILDSVSIKKSYAFLVNRASNLADFFSTISAREPLVEAQIYPVDSDYHWYAERPFILKRGGRRDVVKPGRGINTTLLGELINIFEMGAVAAVPNTSYVGSYELQEFVVEDEHVEDPEKLSFNWGRLISFSWFLGMRDYHFDNIKISSKRFVLCDNEIILSPRLEKNAYKGRRDSEFVQMIQESIIGTNLLPTRFPENCNLKGVDERGAIFFNKISADIESVVEGFNFQNKINGLNANVGLECIEQLLGKLKIRCVFRPTNFYAKLLWRASLSKTYFDSEPYNFKILNALNKFPKEYDCPYFKICEEEKIQLDLGSFPIFHHGNPEIDKFFQPISIENIRSAFCERLKSDQQHLLRICLSVNQELEKTINVEDGIALFKSYLIYQDKTVFKNSENNFTRLLSLTYMPTTNEHVVGPIDDGLYNGMAGIISIFPSLTKDKELTRLSGLFLDQKDPLQTLANGLSSGGAGVASTILSIGLCPESKLSERVLDLMSQSKAPLEISKGGIFEAKNGLIYTGLLASSLLKDKGFNPLLSVNCLSSSFECENFDGIDLGLAHGFVGSQFLKSWYQNEFRVLKKPNDLDKWQALIKTEISSKNGICGGIDGLVLAVSKLQVRYGGYEPLFPLLNNALLQANMLDNKWLCHGYVGQIWSRYIFDRAFGSSTLSHFEVRQRTNLIINEIKQALVQKKLLDVSLFNGAMGVLAVDRLLNGGCEPSSSMHIFPSFDD
jgi:hypothetical protein